MLTFWYKHCERVTSGGTYIRELDGLRFLALLMVFLLHLNHAVLGHPNTEPSLGPMGASISAALEYGAHGVHLFFAISGFILALPFARSALLGAERVSLKNFYLRRLTRLEPPLIIHLTIMLVIYVVFVGKTFGDLLPHYGATVTYIHSHLYGYPSPINPMTWSLEVEAQFYLCAPFLCTVFWIRNPAWRRFIILAAIFIFGIFGNAIPRTVLLGQLPHFLGGLLLADIYLVDWKSDPKSSAWADVFAVAGVIAFGFICYHHKSIPLVRSVTALLIFSFYFCVFRGVIFRRIFNVRALATIGGMCYTFYLYHLAVITTCSRLLERCFDGYGYFATYLFYLIIVGAVNFFVCSILFALFERPFMMWRPREGNWLNGIFNFRKTPMK